MYLLKDLYMHSWTPFIIMRRGKGRRGEFSNFSEKKEGESSDFSHKKGGVGKIGGLFYKTGYHLFSLFSYQVTLSSVVFL